MYNNPLNKLIWEKASEMFYWNVAPESPISQLPFTAEFINACEKEFQMFVRNSFFPIKLGTVEDWQHNTFGDFKEHFLLLSSIITKYDTAPTVCKNFCRKIKNNTHEMKIINTQLNRKIKI